MKKFPMKVRDIRRNEKQHVASESSAGVGLVSPSLLPTLFLRERGQTVTKLPFLILCVALLWTVRKASLTRSNVCPRKRLSLQNCPRQLQVRLRIKVISTGGKSVALKCSPIYRTGHERQHPLPPSSVHHIPAAESLGRRLG